MKLGHLATPDGLRLFAADEQGWILVGDVVADAPATVDEIIADGGSSLPRIRAALASSATPGAPDGVVGTPLAVPTTVIAIGLNYLDHCREYGVEPPSDLVVFAKLPPSWVADGEPVRWSPAITSAVDWEAELGVVIGRETRDVRVEDALDAVFGYTIVNDVTARDIQKTEHQWVRAKSIDTFCPIGPVIVTADAIADPTDIGIRARVNGETLQDSSTKEMIFSVAEIISRLSRSMTLRPGDVIATGTPVGVGAFRTPPIFLGDGDVVEVEIDGIGVLTNRFETVES